MKSLAYRTFLLLLFFVASPVVASDTVLITGRIMDIDDRPIAGAELFIYDSANTRRPADFISPRTGNDGLYKLTVPRKKYWAVARVRQGDQYGPLLPGDRHSGEPLVVEADDGEVQLDFTVADIQEAARQKQKVRVDHHKVAGRVLDSSGKPVKDCYVFATSGTKAGEIPEYISPWTAEDGGYTLYLPAGRYRLTISREFPPKATGKPATELVVTPDQKSTVLDLHLAP